MHTVRSLRALTSITLAFSFFITPLAPVLAQTAPDPSVQPATDTSTADQSTPQTSAPDTTVAPDTSAPSVSDTDNTGQSAGKGNDKSAADSPSDPTTNKQSNDKKQTSPQLSMLSGGSGDPLQLGVYDRGVHASLIQPQKNNGSFDYSFSLTVPPGRNGMTPSLALTYNNRTTALSNWFGYGWSLSIPYIERLNKRGVTAMYSDDTYWSSLDGELVKTGTTSFVPKSDNGAFHSYTLLNNVWTMKDKQGVTYTFGATPGARMDDRKHQPSLPKC